MMNQIKLEDGIELVVDNRGKTPAKLNGEFTDKGYRVISALNVHNGIIDNQEQIRCVNDELYSKWQQTPIERDDCFIASEGASLGESAIWDSDEKIVLGQRLYAIRLNKNVIDPWYFAFYMQTKIFREQVINTSTGSTVFGISQPVLLGLKIFIPDIISQRKIGLLYKNIYRQIQRNNEMVQKLQVLAHTIYSRWFIQFDYPNSTNKLIFNKELKKEIPVNWNVKKLSDICNILLGGTPKTEINEYWGGNIHWLNSGEIANFPVVTSDLNITELGLNNSATKLMKAGTTVVSITGNIRASFLAIESCANQSVVGIEENELFKVNFLYPFINNLVDYYEKSSTGNCQKHINKGVIENSYILIPPSELLVKYNQYTENIYKQIASVSLLNENLINLKNKILPLLINQQLA